jgi:ATP-dependent Lon protease
LRKRKQDEPITAIEPPSKRFRKTEPASEYIQTCYEEDDESEFEDKNSDPESSDSELSDNDCFEDLSLDCDEKDEALEFIKKIIVDCVSKCAPDLSTEDINDTVTNSIKKHLKGKKLFDLLKSLEENDGDEEEDDEYDECEEELDKLPEETASQLKSELKTLRDEIKSGEPTLEKILKAGILKSDKIKALQLYENFKTMDHGSSEYLSTQKEINDIINPSNPLSEEEIQKYHSMEDQLLGQKSTRGSMKHRILELEASEQVKKTLYEMYTSLLSKNPGSDEYCNLREKIEFALTLPHDRVKLPEITMKDKSPIEVQKYCQEIYEKLDERIFGLQNVKEKLVENINNRIYNPNTKSLIAFSGPPGVGKTFTPKILAEVLGLPFDHISLGGLEDPSVIKGSESVWVGSNPGILLRILSRMKYSNGIVLLDEIDKMDKKVQDAVLSIIDYTQNHKIDDRYLSEYHHDLSKIWFMVTMNDPSQLEPPLLNRLDVIEIPSYDVEEKENIITNFMLPKVCKDLGIGDEDLSITKEACQQLLMVMKEEQSESGLRCIESEMRSIISKINMLRTFNNKSSFKDKLSYKLSDFNGFPYTISTQTINSLYKRKKHREISDMVRMMYF